MRICFSILPDGRLASHFGESGRYVLFDTATGMQIEQAAGSESCRGPCHCSVPDFTGIDLVICPAIGHLALRSLKALGVPVYQTREHNMMSAITGWQADQLPTMEKASCNRNRHTRNPKQVDGGI